MIKLEVNKVFLSGNLTRNPDAKSTATGDSFCKIGMAANRRFKNKAGEYKTKVVYINVTVWGQTAEWCGDNLKKGMAIHVEGRLEMNEWEDRETGEARSTIEIAGERVQQIEKEETRGNAGAGNPKHENEPIPEDDIPF